MPRPGCAGWTGLDCSKDETPSPSPEPTPSPGLTPMPGKRPGKKRPPPPIAMASPPPPPSPSPPVPRFDGKTPVLPRPPPPPADPCAHTGPTDPPNRNSRNSECHRQANCVYPSYNSRDCVYRTDSRGVTALYCRVCLAWAGDCMADRSVSYVCSGDETTTVLEDGPTGNQVPGGSNLRNPWDRLSNYCQWLRWEDGSNTPQTIEYSIRGGDGSMGTCNDRNRPVRFTTNGLDGTCDNPRLDRNNQPAGCAGVPDSSADCLWTLSVPRPGGPGWNGRVCLPDPPSPPTPVPVPSPGKRPAKAPKPGKAPRPRQNGETASPPPPTCYGSSCNPPVRA